MFGAEFMRKLLDGTEVEWKILREIFDLRNGYTPSKNNPSFWKDGTIPWFRMEDIRENGRILSKSIQHVTQSAVKGGRIFPANSIIVATSATIGEHALITVPHLTNQRFTCLSLKSDYRHLFDIKFLFYYCFVLDKWCVNNTNASSFASVDIQAFRKFKIPRPCPDNPEKSLSIQTQIVQILDTFTAVTSELTSELILRKKQYEYYRDALLSFDTHTITQASKQASKQAINYKIIWINLGEIAKIKHGKDWKNQKKGDVPVYGTGGIMGHVQNHVYDKPSVLLPRKGSISNIFYVDTPFWNIDTIFYTEIDESKIVPKFMYYFLKTIDLTTLDTGSGRPSLTQAVLSKIRVPIPYADSTKKSLEEQSRIVTILDKFNTLTTSLTEGLPREIKLRQKQYEYYRDLLLRFPTQRIQHG